MPSTSSFGASYIIDMMRARKLYLVKRGHTYYLENADGRAVSKGGVPPVTAAAVVADERVVQVPEQGVPCWAARRGSNETTN